MGHFLDDSRESLELNRLLGSQGILFEEWNDHFGEMLQISHPPTISIPMILPDHSASHDGADSIQERNIFPMLHHREFRQDLISLLHFVMSIDGDVETSLTIDKPDDPVGCEFLIHTRFSTFGL